MQREVTTFTAVRKQVLGHPFSLHWHLTRYVQNPSIADLSPLLNPLIIQTRKPPALLRFHYTGITALCFHRVKCSN